MKTPTMLILIAALLATSCATTMQRRGDPVVRVPELSSAEIAQGCHMHTWPDGLLERRCPPAGRSMQGRRHGESIITTQRFCAAFRPDEMGGRVEGIYREGLLVGCKR